MGSPNRPQASSVRGCFGHTISSLVAHSLTTVPEGEMGSQTPGVLNEGDRNVSPFHFFPCYLPIFPEFQQMVLNQAQDPIKPGPEGETFGGRDLLEQQRKYLHRSYSRSIARRWDSI